MSFAESGMILFFEAVRRASVVGLAIFADLSLGGISAGIVRWFHAVVSASDIGAWCREDIF